jgi:hypothetical protein
MTKIVTAAVGLGLTNVQIVGKARQENILQKKLNAMQLSVARGEVALNKQAEAAKKELDQIEKVKNNLFKIGQKPVANYGTLAAMWTNRLSHITKESLEKEAAEDAKKFVSRAFNPKAFTEEQLTIITRYFAIKAAKSWGVISQVGAILEREYGAAAVALVKQSAQVEEAEAHEATV